TCPGSLSAARLRRPPSSPLSPYTTLFRSAALSKARAIVLLCSRRATASGAGREPAGSGGLAQPGAQALEPAVAQAEGVEVIDRVDEVFGAGSQDALGASDDLGDGVFRELPGVARVAAVDRERDRRDRPLFRPGADQARTIGARHHFAPPEEIQLERRFRSGDSEHDAMAASAPLQTQHQPGPLRGPAPQRGPEAEATMPAAQHRHPALDERSEERRVR